MNVQGHRYDPAFAVFVITTTHVLLCSACHVIFPFNVDPPVHTDDARSRQDSAGKLDRGPDDDHGLTDARVVPDAPHSPDLHAWPDGGALPCNPVLDTCPSNLACHCCGSIGPKSICICTTTCTGHMDCTRPIQPFCNKVSPAATAGICTPPTFNCCWLCQ